MSEARIRKRTEDVTNEDFERKSVASICALLYIFDGRTNNTAYCALLTYADDSCTTKAKNEKCDIDIEHKSKLINWAKTLGEHRTLRNMEQLVSLLK